MISLAVAADIYPGKLTTPLLRQGKAAEVVHGLAGVLEMADLRIANLEGPLTDRATPINKIGPIHAIDEGCIRGLAACRFDVLGLGNNHIMDQGWPGLKRTIQLCREQGISTVGAGQNLAEAGKPLVKTLRGTRVGILAYAEHEFGMAGSDRPGANPLDLIHFVRVVREHRGSWDRLLVLLHAGTEYYPYPRPELREICRFMVEQGADAVICQHSHCVGCHESHCQGQIVYGQGNFVFDDRSARPCEQEGALILLDMGENGVRLRWEPFFQSADRPGPDVDAVRAAGLLGEIEGRSCEIARPGLVEQRWAEYCRENSQRYLALIQGWSRRWRNWDRRFGFLRWLRRPEQTRMWLHVLRCESHREALITTLETAHPESTAMTDQTR